MSQAAFNVQREDVYVYDSAQQQNTKPTELK